MESLIVARLLRPESNLGFAGGANAGIAAARAPLILLLNPDVVGVRPHHRRVDEVDDAEVGGFGGVAVLDLLDQPLDTFVKEDGAIVAKR